MKNNSEDIFLVSFFVFTLIHLDSMKRKSVAVGVGSDEKKARKDDAEEEQPIVHRIPDEVLSIVFYYAAPFHFVCKEVCKRWNHIYHSQTKAYIYKVLGDERAAIGGGGEGEAEHGKDSSHLHTSFLLLKQMYGFENPAKIVEFCEWVWKSVQYNVPYARHQYILLEAIRANCTHAITWALYKGIKTDISTAIDSSFRYASYANLCAVFLSFGLPGGITLEDVKKHRNAAATHGNLDLLETLHKSNILFGPRERVGERVGRREELLPASTDPGTIVLVELFGAALYGGQANVCQWIFDLDHMKPLQILNRMDLLKQWPLRCIYDGNVHILVFLFDHFQTGVLSKIDKEAVTYGVSLNFEKKNLTTGYNHSGTAMLHGLLNVPNMFSASMGIAQAQQYAWDKMCSRSIDDAVFKRVHPEKIPPHLRTYYTSAKFSRMNSNRRDQRISHKNTLSAIPILVEDIWIKYVSALKSLGFSSNLNKNTLTFSMKLWYDWGFRLIDATNPVLKEYRDVFYHLWLKHVFSNRSVLTHGESFCVWSASTDVWDPHLGARELRGVRTNKRRDPWVVAKVKDHPTFIKIYDEGMKSSTYFAFTDEKQKEENEKLRAEAREEYEVHKKWRSSVPKNDEIWKDEEEEEEEEERGKGKEKEEEEEEEEEEEKNYHNDGTFTFYLPGDPEYIPPPPSPEVDPTDWKCDACECTSTAVDSYCTTCLSPRKGVVPAFPM